MGNSDNNIIENIKNKIQKILNRKFKNDISYRRKIDIYQDRFNFCCPVCGDSVSDNRKKRGNLYYNDLGYHCYNCGYHAGINYFLKRFDEELSNDDKIIVHELQQSSKKFERKTATRQSSMIFKIIDLIAIPKSIFLKINNLVTPYKNEYCSNYLQGRKINKKFWKYFAFNEKSKELFILNINQNDRIIGYQIRQLNKDSKKPRYLTRSISKIYNEMFNKNINYIIEKLLDNIELGKKYIEEEDGIENIVANIDKISGLFNIMNVDISKQLTIVEGPIDSLAIDNCIALQGATKMNGYFDNVKNVRYLFDNDKVGKTHTLSKLKEHKKVFLWDMYLKKIKAKEKIKDVNDLQKTGNYNMDIFEDCFSDDEFDVMFV